MAEHDIGSLFQGSELQEVTEIFGTTSSKGYWKLVQYDMGILSRTIFLNISAITV
jgi:hypothetical protein